MACLGDITFGKRNMYQLVHVLVIVSALPREATVPEVQQPITNALYLLICVIPARARIILTGFCTSTKV